MASAPACPTGCCAQGKHGLIALRHSRTAETQWRGTQFVASSVSISASSIPLEHAEVEVHHWPMGSQMMKSPRCCPTVETVETHEIAQLGFWMFMPRWSSTDKEMTTRMRLLQPSPKDIRVQVAI